MTANDTTYTLFAQAANGLVKISHTKNPTRRMKQLQKKYGPMALLGFVASGHEHRGISESFQADRVRGIWHVPSANMQSFIHTNANKDIALPGSSSLGRVVPDRKSFEQERARLGGLARARKLSKTMLREIGRLGGKSGGRGRTRLSQSEVATVVPGE